MELIKRIGGSFLAVAMLFAFSAMPANAQGVSDQQAQINALLAQVDALTKLIAQLQGGSGAGAGSTTMTSCSFTRNLSLGNEGADVMDLQKFLNSHGAVLASSGAGSPGFETSYFGPITKSAVTRWQNANASVVLNPLGLTSGTGYFGTSSRAHANSMCTVMVPGNPTSGQPPVTPAFGTATVSAGTQPTNSLAPQKAARVPFTTFRITAGAKPFTLNKVKVHLEGLADEAAFSNVMLLAGDRNGLQLGNGKSFNSLDDALVGEPFVIPAGTTQNFTIVGNMATSLTARAGEVAVIAVTEVQGSEAVSGLLPIRGAAHTMNATLGLGTATVDVSSQTNPSTAEEIGTTDYIFGGVRITAGSAEDIRVHSIRWNQIGSVSNSDLNNIHGLVDGVKYPVTISDDGDFWTIKFGDGLVQKKGLQRDYLIVADLIGGSTRTVITDIEKATDIYITGETFKYGITPTAGTTADEAVGTQQMSNSTPPFYDGITVTVNAGSFSSASNWSAGAPAANIAIANPDAILGGYQINLVGEPITIDQSVFHISNATTSQSIINVTLFDENGNAIAGPEDAAANGVVTFSDSITYPTGMSKYLLRGNLSASTGGWTTGDTVTASTTPSSDWTGVEGDVTGDTIDLSGLGLITMSQMTVKPVAMTVSSSALPVAQTIVSGSRVEFARYVLDATASGEDARVANLPLYYDTNGTRTDLTNCQLYNEAGASKTSGSNVFNPSTSGTASSTTLTFDGGGLIVPKGTTQTLSLRCDLVSGSTSLYWWGLDAGQQTSYTGITGISSGQTAGETLVEANGQIMTAAANGTYTVTSDSSILYRTAQAGTSDVTLGAFRFDASTVEPLDIKGIALQLANTASNSPADLVGERMTIWDGSTQVGIAQFGTSNPDHATSTLSSLVRVAKGETKTLVVKGSLLAHDAINGTPGAFMSVTYDADNNGLNGNYASGVDSNVTIAGSTTSDVTTNGLRIFRTLPTLEVTSTGGDGTLSVGSDLYKVKVTAGANRDVLLKTMTFNVTSTGIGFASGLKLYGPGGAVNGTAAATSTDSGLSGDRLRITFDDTHADRLVQKGTSKTFALRLESIEGLTSANVEDVTFALVSDTAYPSIANLMGSVANIEGSASTTDRFIWSPNSTTTPEATAAKNSNLDWTNSYGIPGFPSVGQNFSTQSFRH